MISSRLQTPGGRACLLAVLLLAHVAGRSPASSAPAPARSATVLEYEVKSAFLYNFAKFVDWPEPESATLVIGILGFATHHQEIRDTLVDQMVDRRPLEIRWFDTPDTTLPCDVLFVAPSFSDQLPALLERLEEPAMLTVGEGMPFIQAGGIISFVVEHRKIRFVINPDAALRADLQIRSELLSLATIAED